jgi:hypothetical protein
MPPEDPESLNFSLQISEMDMRSSWEPDSACLLMAVKAEWRNYGYK